MMGGAASGQEEEKDGGIVEDNGNDLFEEQDLLNQQPKSKSPQLGRANVKKIMDSQQNVLILDG